MVFYRLYSTMVAMKRIEQPNQNWCWVQAENNDHRIQFLEWDNILTIGVEFIESDVLDTVLTNTSQD